MTVWVTLALLHLAPLPGETESNKRTVEEAVLRAAGLGATFIVTPELAVSGYGFRDVIGTGWIVTALRGERPCEAVRETDLGREAGLLSVRGRFAA